MPATLLERTSLAVGDSRSRAKLAMASAIAQLRTASGSTATSPGSPRNGSTKLSEHAFGNALDIASFRLADGRTIAVAPDLKGESRTFLDRLRTAACGPFRTVLGPGADADHANHLHLDLAPRRSDNPICE